MSLLESFKPTPASIPPPDVRSKLRLNRPPASSPVYNHPLVCCGSIGLKDTSLISRVSLLESFAVLTEGGPNLS
jgi:hypothetical protein